MSNIYRLYDQKIKFNQAVLTSLDEGPYWNKKGWGIFQTVNEFLAPDLDDNSSNAIELSTYFRICKCRSDGARTRYAAKTAFNIATNQYQPKYIPGRLKNCGTIFEPLKEGDTIPSWANPNHIILNENIFEHCNPITFKNHKGDFICKN